MTRPTRHSWQHDDCPPWCEGGHTESDHPDDRFHRSEGSAIPVITRRTAVVDNHLTHIVEATELKVGLSRAIGDAEIWVYLDAEGDRGFELSLESATRLISSLRSPLTLPGVRRARIETIARYAPPRRTNYTGKGGVTMKCHDCGGSCEKDDTGKWRCEDCGAVRD